MTPLIGQFCENFVAAVTLVSCIRPHHFIKGLSAGSLNMRKRRNILTARANFLAWLSETLFLVLLIPGSLNDSQVCL